MNSFLIIISIITVCIAALRYKEALNSTKQFRDVLKHPEVIELRQLPGFIIVLLLLIEDKWFFTSKNLRPSKPNSGITRQLVNNIFRPKLGIIFSKLNEMLYLLALERSFTKTEILLLFLHTMPMGKCDLVGIRNGSTHYFNVKPERLTIEQAFFLFTLKSKSISSTHNNIIDFSRFLFKECGIWSLRDPRLLTFYNGIALMKRYHTFRHDQFSLDEQAGFEMRAALMLDNLNQVVVDEYVLNTNSISRTSI